MTKENLPSPDEAKKMRQTQDAARFVDEALFPFIVLVRAHDRDIHPIVEDMEALVWGFQSGFDEELSIPVVGEVLRRRVSEAEQSRSVFHFSATDDMKTLKMVEEALPLVNSHFSERKDIILFNEQNLSVPEENLGTSREESTRRGGFFKNIITRLKSNRKT